MQIFIYLFIHFGLTRGTRGNKSRGNMGDQEETRVTWGNTVTRVTRVTWGYMG